MTDYNVVSLKAITPPRWEGEVTDYMLEMIVKGLLVPNVETSRRLAYELLELRGEEETKVCFCEGDAVCKVCLPAEKDYARISELKAALAAQKVSHE